MKGRVGMMVGAISLLAVGVLFAQQPQGASAATTVPAAAQQPQGSQAQAKPAPATKVSTAKLAARPKWTKGQITEAQEGLKRAKVYDGPPNGVLGRATRRAIRAFQREHKLTVNGALSDSLLSMLKAIPQ